MTHFIGIDIGTSSICGVVYNFSDKKLESVTKLNDTGINSPNPWEKTQDPVKILERVTDIITPFLAAYPNIKGIGVTGQMHGMLYTNHKGDAVSPLYTWQDGRGNLTYKGTETYAEYLSAKTARALATGFGLVTHFYNKENNLVPPTAEKLCTIMDFVVMKLTGRQTPLTDYSNAASLGFFDKQYLRFDTQSLKSVGIDTTILPEIAQSATLAGYYTHNIPVYSAIGDNQASFLGSVTDSHASIHITVGTSSQISVYSEKYLEVDSLDTRPFPGGGYILVGAALCGGQSFAVLKKFFEDTLKLFVGELFDKADVYKTISSMVYNANHEGMPVVETLFDGTRFEPGKRGSISGISTTNLTPENVIVGFAKGVCHELYTFYNAIPEGIKQNKTLLIGSGNGIKKNALLRHAFEDRFNCQLQLSGCDEEAAFGACLCAVVGGHYVNSFFEG